MAKRPEPTPSDELGPSPTVTTTMVPSPTMTELPVTGTTDDVAWGALALGVVVLAAGVLAAVTMRVRRARTG